MKNILDIAIHAEGGVGKLADSLQVRQNVISNWRARQSIPNGWQKLLEYKYRQAEITSPAPELTDKAAA